jgi:hypothetical protein
MVIKSSIFWDIAPCKVKLSLCLTNEDIWGSGCIDPRFLHLGTVWKWVVRFTPRPLYPQGMRLRYSVDRRLITLCSPLKANRCFGRTSCLHLQGRIITRERNQRESRWQAGSAFTLVSYSAYSSTWRCRWNILPKSRLTFNGRHGVISQKTELVYKTFGTELLVRTFLQILQSTERSVRPVRKLTIALFIDPFLCICPTNVDCGYVKFVTQPHGFARSPSL